MSKQELDDTAYEALKAHPVMVEEAMTNQDGAFWAKLSNHMRNGAAWSILILIEGAVDNYVDDQLEELSNDEEISLNEAIHKLLNRCNGGK